MNQVQSQQFKLTKSARTFRINEILKTAQTDCGLTNTIVFLRNLKEKQELEEWEEYIIKNSNDIYLVDWLLKNS